MDSNPPENSAPQRSDKESRNLITASWALIGFVMLLSLVPFLGFASWLIATPVLFITLIMGILILSRGGTMPGLLILLTSLIFAPAFIMIAPFVSSFLGLVGTGAALSSMDQPTSGSRHSPPPNYRPSSSTAPSQSSAASSRATQPSSLEVRSTEERRRMFAAAPQLIVGTWRYENALLTYNPDGTVSFRFDDGNRAKANWRIDDDVVVFSNYRMDNNSNQRSQSFRRLILEINKTTKTTKSLGEDDRIWQATRVK
jgi:hypothetical protein